MKILITGGAGFIGSNIADALIERDYEVVILDNLSTGFKENIHPKAKFYEASICDNKAVSDIFKKEKPDIVSHQAAQIDVRKSIDDPIFDAKENIIGSLNIIINSLNLGVKKIIYASTVGVYGEPRSLPVDENHPINPISSYGISKHTIEHYLYLYSANYGLKYTALRYPNVYGPRQNPHGEAGVVAIFINKLLESKRPTIFGDGEQTRDYIHVSDIVEANILAMTRGINEVFNIGRGIEISVNELFSTLNKVLQSDLTPVYGPRRTGDISRISLDSSKARRELGWAPKLNFKDGIIQTIEYYKTSAVTTNFS